MWIRLLHPPFQCPGPCTCACVYVYNNICMHTQCIFVQVHVSVYICVHTAVLQFVCVCACECVCFMFTHATWGMRGRICSYNNFLCVWSLLPHISYTKWTWKHMSTMGEIKESASTLMGEGSLFLTRYGSVAVWLVMSSKDSPTLSICLPTLFDHMLTQVPIKMTELHCHIMFDHMYTKYQIKLQTHADLFD